MPTEEDVYFSPNPATNGVNLIGDFKGFPPNVMIYNVLDLWLGDSVSPRKVI
ncbi:MAG: hypothetical protein JKX73_05525 [Flavobacteriales bacterium]|nr:hypothetical protein [Flavobacteriales bacterium]